MDIATINRSLHRPLDNGRGFDQYFPASACKQTKLATGNTKVALREMSKWAKRYVDHTAALSKEVFSKYPLEVIPEKLHDFLYKHIQYKIDTREQYLKSPACTWVTRTEGADCKSYSIFASTILLNLGIKHYLRRVRQKDIHPTAYTHVYVVIPDNQETGSLSQGYSVVDATLRSNKEVPFIQKDDKYMEPSLPIYGLASPALGCASCSDHSHYAASGLASPSFKGQKAIDLGEERFDEILGYSLAKFDEYIAALKSINPESRTIDHLHTAVYRKIASGVDPQLRFTSAGIYVDNEFFNLKNTIEKAKHNPHPAIGLGVVPLLAAGGAVAGKTGLLAGATKAFSFVSNLLPKDFFSDTFGAVFANGFDLSCWNSTFTPAKVSAEVQKVHVPFFEKALADASNATTHQELEDKFNFLVKAVDISYDMYYNKLANATNWRSCSRKSIQIYKDIVEGVKLQTDRLLKTMEDKLNITVHTAKAPAKYTYPQSYHLFGKDFTWDESHHGQSEYRSIKVNPNLFQQAQDAYNKVSGEAGGAVKTAGSSGMSKLFMGAALIGGLVYGAKKFK